MHSRTEAALRRELRTRLERLGMRRPEAAAERLLERARGRARREGRPLPRAFAELHAAVWRAALRRGQRGAPGSTAEPAFACDESLGALARWLRAAGYPARALAGRTDEVVREADRAGEVLLTSDGRVLERNRVRAGALRCLWVPTALSRREQVALVLGELGLARREPRCMACGGELRAVAKATVRDRIPPRTARWLDEYFVCAGCERLYWRGTHWERIARGLGDAGD